MGRSFRLDLWRCHPKVSLSHVGIPDFATPGPGRCAWPRGIASTAGWDRHCISNWSSPSPLIALPQIVALLSSLASSTAPLIEDLNGRLGEGDLADDARAWDAFRDSHLALTALGASVLAGETDVVDVRGIDRWWGGTRLKGDTCWRWDDGARSLISPARM
jgi:hypothetical protein